MCSTIASSQVAKRYYMYNFQHIYTFIQYFETKLIRNEEKLLKKRKNENKIMKWKERKNISLYKKVVTF